MYARTFGKALGQHQNVLNVMPFSELRARIGNLSLDKTLA